jgi:hypothetical protein
MKKFVEKNFVIIVLVIALLSFFKGCGDGRELAKIRKEVEAIKDSTYTKQELNVELQIMGLESEKRMIQATDRKFLVPILAVAGVSISHVTTWFGISNPFTWAIYLSIGVEIAALSAVAAISAKMGKKVYLPFGIVTLLQFIGNIFFAYQYIDINGQLFKDWVEMVDPVVSYLGVESGDFIGHKRFLSLFAGGMLPIISLSFLHMLVKFEEEGKTDAPEPEIDIEALSTEAGKKEAEVEKEKYVPTQEDLQRLEEELRRVNEQKFGNLTEETSDPINEDQVKRLSYSRRDA